MNKADTPPHDLIERVKLAIRTFTVEGFVYADDAGSCYRVMKGVTSIGGDYSDLAEAQESCDWMNARAAWLALTPPPIQGEYAGLVERLRDFNTLGNIVLRNEAANAITTLTGERSVTELDANGEAMMCDGCGTTQTIAAILAKHGPGAIACCPERKMVAARYYWERALTATKPQPPHEQG